MTTILPNLKPPKQPSVGERFAQAFSNLAQDASTKIPEMLLGQKQAQQENEALKAFGIDLSNIQDPTLRKIIAEQHFKKKQENLAPFQQGLSTIEEMRKVLDRGNLGRGSSLKGFFGGQTAHDRSEYEQLGKSLIPLVAAGVPIRNQKEFEEYSKVITDPSSPESAIKGALNGLERILSRKIAGEEEEEGVEEKQKKILFDPENREHKAKAMQLFKKFKDKEKVREALSREFSF